MTNDISKVTFDLANVAVPQNNLRTNVTNDSQKSNMTDDISKVTFDLTNVAVTENSLIFFFVIMSN